MSDEHESEIGELVRSSAGFGNREKLCLLSMHLNSLARALGGGLGWLLGLCRSGGLACIILIVVVSRRRLGLGGRGFGGGLALLGREQVGAERRGHCIRGQDLLLSLLVSIYAWLFRKTYLVAHLDVQDESLAT